MASAKLKAASALYHLKTKKYKLAALKFTEVCCAVCRMLLCLGHTCWCGWWCTFRCRISTDQPCRQAGTHGQEREAKMCRTSYAVQECAC